MEEEQTVTMQLTEFEAWCIEAIRRIQQHQQDLMDWKGIIICSKEWHRELVLERIRWKRIAEEMESEKDAQFEEVIDVIDGRIDAALRIEKEYLDVIEKVKTGEIKSYVADGFRIYNDEWFVNQYRYNKSTRRKK